MDYLKKGDVIYFNDDREVVLARLEGLLWTASLNGKGGQGPVLPVQEIDTLITYGWEKES